MPKMKTKSGAAKRFRALRQRQHQAQPGQPAPHPHQEEHQAQAPSARHDAVNASDQRAIKAMLPYA